MFSFLSLVRWTVDYHFIDNGAALTSHASREGEKLRRGGHCPGVLNTS
jgi:hypothetical protein